MHNLGARQSWIPVAQIRCSVGHKWRCNETHSVNESHLGQQRLRATRIPADDIRSSAGVKSIRRLHGVLNLRFNVGDEPHAATYELKVRMNPCHMCQKKKRPASSSWRNKSGYASFSQASFHASLVHSFFKSGDGNASLQLSLHRYRDWAVSTTPLCMSSNP